MFRMTSVDFRNFWTNLQYLPTFVSNISFELICFIYISYFNEGPFVFQWLKCLNTYFHLSWIDTRENQKVKAKYI